MNRPRIAFAALLAAIFVLATAAFAQAATVSARLAGRPVVHGSLISVPAILAPGSARALHARSPVVTITAPRRNGVRILRPARLRLGDLLQVSGAALTGTAGVRATRLLTGGRRGRAPSFGRLDALVAGGRTAGHRAAAALEAVKRAVPNGKVPVAQRDAARDTAQRLKVEVGFLRDRVEQLRGGFATSAAGASLDLAGVARGSRVASARRAAIVAPLARSRDALAGLVKALDDAVTSLDEAIIEIGNTNAGPADDISLPLDGVGSAGEAIQAVERLLASLPG
jgi:hypothetical protein